jgi:hypothetical protein
VKVFGTGVSIGAGLLASKVVNVVWQKTTGKEVPKRDDDLENSLRSALAFALISGAVGTTIQVLAKRGTARAIRHFEKTREVV